MVHLSLDVLGPGRGGAVDQPRGACHHAILLTTARLRVASWVVHLSLDVLGPGRGGAVHRPRLGVSSRHLVDDGQVEGGQLGGPLVEGAVASDAGRRAVELQHLVHLVDPAVHRTAEHAVTEHGMPEHGKSYDGIRWAGGNCTAECAPTGNLIERWNAGLGIVPWNMTGGALYRRGT